MLTSLDKSGVPYELFDSVEEDPGAACVQRGAEMVSKGACDGVIVVGGGSPLCAGRAIALLATNGGTIRDYAGINKASKPPLPVIGIPTTAGSGAEVSQYILLKDEVAHTKMVVGGATCFPETAILDPLLLTGLPFWQFVVSGIDALSHAIEAFCTSLTTPITDALALTAISLLYNDLPRAAATSDLDAKEACLIGSTMANMACGNARLGLAHAMTVPMEGMFRIPHGIAVGTLLPYVMEFNLPASFPRFAQLARVLGRSDRGQSVADIAPEAVVAVKKLYVDLEFPRKYSDDVVDRKSIPEMVTKMAGGLYGGGPRAKDLPMNALVQSPNIRKATIKDVIEIFEKAFEGWDL
jgi:alcohol dehydrogenase class IV